MKRIAIIGAGAMGSGIGLVAALAGHDVVIYDAVVDCRIKARDNIQDSLQKLASKGKITEQESKAVSERTYFVENIDGIKGSALVIEAIVENEAEKKKLYALIKPLLSEDAILASNTSSLSITGLANGLVHPERFIGIHFFNP